MTNQDERLFKQVKQLEKKKIWESIDSSSLFALQYSWMTQPVFVAVTGKNGEKKGVFVYRSLEEVTSYFDAFQQHQTKKDVSFFQLKARQNCVSLVFVDRMEVPTGTYNRIKESGISFRGKEAWPVFLSYTAGYVPEVASYHEEELLSAVVYFLLLDANIGTRIRLDEEKLDDSQLPFYRVDETQTIQTTLYSFPEEWLDVSEPHPEDIQPILVSSFELERAKRLPMGTFLWEMDVQYVNQPIVAEDETRAAYPLVFFIGDPVKKEVLETEVLFQKDSEQIQRTLLQQMITKNTRPPHIAFETFQARQILPKIQAVLESLGIESIIVDTLAYLSIVKATLRKKLDEQVDDEEEEDLKT